MKFKGVLLRPVDQQGDIDGHFIDPAGVEFDPNEDYVISPNFDHNVPPVGHGKITRAEDGGLVVEGELFAGKVNEDEPPRLAIGVIADKFVEGVNSETRFMAMALTAMHQDPNQPPIEILKEPDATS